MKKTKRLASILLALVMLFSLVPAMSSTAYAASTTVTITQSDFGGWGPSFTKDGVTVSADLIDPEDGNLLGGGTFSTTLGNFTKIQVTCRSAYASGAGWSGGGTWTGNASVVPFSGDFIGRGTGITIVCTIELPNVAVTGVSLNKTSTTLTVGDTETLTATVSPDDATDKSVSWSSDNTAVATVADGVVTAVAAGTANITATSNADSTKSASCAVTVNAAVTTHEHEFTYSASGATITATCTAAGCELTDSKVTLTIGDPANIYYNDGASSHAFTLEGLDDFNTATGKTISVDDLVYYKGDNQSSDIKNNRVKGATYKARLTVEGVRAEHSFTFTAKPQPHTHSFTYTANGNVITATCTQNAANMEACDLPNKQATLTLNAPAHKTYGDGLEASATLTGEIPGVSNPTINYRKSDTPLSSAPTDAGTYTAWCQLGNATARVEYTIDKAANTGYTTPPHAITGLVYTGQAQALITEGTASAGSILYGLGAADSDEDAYYTGAVPSAVNAGTYYVWYKIDGGKNYTSINAQKIEVSIAKADITPSVSLVGWTYGETANTPMVGDAANPGNGEVTYTYKVKGADDSTYTTTVPTNAGDYTVKATVAATNNYNGGEATADFTIAKANPTYTAPTGLTATYGDTLADVTLPEGWAWADSSQSVGNAGTNTFKANYTPSDTANYNTVENIDVSVTVAKATGTATDAQKPTAKTDLVADNTEQALVTAPASLPEGYTAIQYSLDGETWADTIPTGKDAGDYTVNYKYVGDSNHNDFQGEPLTVTIKTLTVTFEVNGGSAVAAQNVIKGEKATKPDDPTKAGNAFDGWFQDATFSVAFDFDTPVTADMTLYAKWTPNDYTLQSITGTTTDASHTWTKGSGKDVVITVKLTTEPDNSFAHYVRTEIDGKTVTADAREGSTIVTLKPATLQKLSTGAHTVTIVFDNGQVDVRLTVKPNPSSPATGDTRTTGLWATLTILSGLGIGGVTVFGKKRRKAIGQ